MRSSVVLATIMSCFVLMWTASAQAHGYYHYHHHHSVSHQHHYSTPSKIQSSMIWGSGMGWGGGDTAWEAPRQNSHEAREASRYGTLTTLDRVASDNRTRFGVCARYGRRQCGCTASMIAFGRVVDGLPLASQWERFARTSPHVGAAAIWPGHHHVEIVTAVNGDRVSTTGSVGFSSVSAARLVFVDPSVSTAIVGVGESRQAHRHYTYRYHWSRRHYARA